MHAIKAPQPVPNPTQSYWIKAFPNASKPALARPSKDSAHAHKPQLPAVADVAIIGGGIAGVSAAYHLRKSRPDLKVVLLEARRLSHGATGRNGGLLWPALNAPWIGTAARYGISETSRIMAFELQCLAEVREVIAREGLQGEVRHASFRDGAFYLFAGAEEMERELAELELMQQHGIHRDVTPLSRRETAALLGSDTYAGAVRQPGVSRVWAARLVHALARLAGEAGPREGLVLAEDTRVAAVTPLDQDQVAALAAAAAKEAKEREMFLRSPSGSVRGERGVANNIVPLRPGALQGPLTEALDPTSTPLLQVTTEAGDSLLARRVLHCTNAYGSALLPELRAALVPVRNHVAATRAPEGGPDGFFPLDAAFYARGGYVYWSRREDGRLVLGGFRDVVPDMEWDVYDDGSLRESVQQQLHAYLPHHFPELFDSRGLDPEAEWSGILGFTRDRFPFVGPVPNRPGQFLAAGFSGHGMTRTFTCGRVVAELITGAAPDPAFPASWLPSEGRFGAALPAVPEPEVAVVAG